MRETGASLSKTSLKEPFPESFLAGLEAAIGFCEDRDANVLRLRAGLYGPVQTLEAVGLTLSVTRERVRQIERSAVKRIVSLCRPYIARIVRGGSEALAGRDEPLPLVGLEVLDPWFVGVGANEAPLKFVFEHFFDVQPFWLLRVDDQTFVSKISSEEWEGALRKVRSLLVGMVGRDGAVLVTEARCLSDSMLPEAAADLRELLWSHATRGANFSTTPEGEAILVSLRQGIEGLIEAILVESDCPLHFEEIAKRCSDRGRPLEVGKVYNAASKVGILMARGVYGLERHLPLSNKESTEVVSETENIILENPSKQWHADEIVERLGDLGLDFGERLDKYVVNHALRSSEVLVYLGKFLWALRSRDVQGTSHRISVWQAVTAMLEENAGPMRTDEIRNRLSRNRGLGATSLLLHQADPLIRVGESEWGLLWRDVPFSESEAADVVREIEAACRSRGTGLHVSEIVGSLKSTVGVVSRVGNPVLLTSLACRTGIMKAGRGGYVYPADWESSRRLSVNKAVAAALVEVGQRGGTLAELSNRASALLGRDVPFPVASHSLILAGADYDHEKAVWRVSKRTFGDDEDEGPESLSN
jgi:hypothetical protein